MSKASHPPPTKFIDAVDIIFDATIPYDERFFESLDRMVQAEPWLPRDKAMIDQLRSIGIEKGKPFTPDKKTNKLLRSAAAEARAWLESQYETVFAAPPFYQGTQWAVPVLPEVIDGMCTGFANTDQYPTDGRGLLYSFVFFCAKHLGAGQFYVMTIKDRKGQDFDGSQTYRLTVPANAPVKQYWSATIYDRENHALIRNRPWSSRSSQTPGIQKNADGSVDIYFGPKAPAGRKSNWVPTRAGGRFEVLFRIYGPEKSFFQKTWVLPDIEKTRAA